MMNVSLIVAMDPHFGIGRNNDLLWHLPDDMKFFKSTTLGHVVVMGRKNWDSIPERFRPLSDRHNVVLSRNIAYSLENADVFHSLGTCLEAFSSEKERKIFIIGGGEIYREALDLGVVNEMFITHVEKDYSADTFFPIFNDEEWIKQSILKHPKDEKHESAFEIYHYQRKI
jgi:dihydrofolate reductase